jgi:hypothetical protein
MASIDFVDPFVGPLTLSNGLPSPGDRFAGWTPILEMVGATPVGLADGVTYGWEHRIDYGAEFAIEYLPQSALGDVQRFIRVLQRGEQLGLTATFTVDTGDVDSHSYTCRVWPGSVPELVQSDRGSPIEYRLALRVLNVGDAPMLCSYQATAPEVS